MDDCTQVCDLVREFRAQPGNEVGGTLHIVLDDLNVDNGSVEYCLHTAIAAEDQPGVLIARLMLECSKTQRLKICKSR